MDLAATQIYEDDDFLPTQRISNNPEAEYSIQVGTLSVNSTEYQIKKGITKIGRLSSNNIVINDATVSKIHAEIEASASQGSTWICDLNSSNKTKLNNLILRPSRLYELKNGSILEFGRVRATYCTYCPTDDTIIPETPAPSRQKVTATIIPNTPDSSLNNSSGVDDGSVILGTQERKDERTNSVFRRPSLPQRQSTSTDKRISSRASSVSASDDSQIVIALHVSATDTSDNQENSIFDADTQIFVERQKTAGSIHDVETQEFSKGTHVKKNADKSSLSIRNETTGSSATNIHDMETQHDIDTGEDGNDAQESKVNQTKSRQKNQIQQDIHDLETQKFGDGRITNDIHDVETQLELDCDTNTTEDTNVQSKSNSQTEKDEKNNTANVGPRETHTENVTNTQKSRSSSPGSLNLSSPGVDEDDLSSPLNESVHLLETTDLLEYFSEGIDKNEQVRASNTSTPKPRDKTLLKKDNDKSTPNTSDNEDNIFDVATQRSRRKNPPCEILSSDDSEIDEKNAFIMCEVPKRTKREKLRPKQNDPDDSETDAEEYFEELAKKQRESASTSRKSCDKSTNNKTDPGTSVESEDMFDLPTQRLVDDVQDTPNPSHNQSTKKYETEVISDTAPTQIIKGIEDKRGQDKRSLPLDVNDAPTQFVVPNETSSKTAITKKLSLSNNQNDDMMPTQIINPNDNTTNPADYCASVDDRENTDYELAPTQVIGEVENEDKRNLERENSNLDDTLERNLNQMFEDVNNDSAHNEPSQISTQYLEDILKPSQGDNVLSTNEVVAGISTLTNNTPQTQSRRKNCATNNQSSRDQLAPKTTTGDADNAETDSQNSDIYFSTLSTKRKRNILKDTQEFEDSVNEMTSRQNTNSSKQTKTNEKIEEDNISTRSNRRGKTTNKIDDDVYKTISNEDDKRKPRKSRTTRRRTAVASEVSKQALESDEINVDDAEKDSATNNLNICSPCGSGNGQSAQILDILCDDDILTRLPAVRISGTLSNPPSPCESSTSKLSRISKRDVTINEENKRGLRNKSVKKRVNTEKGKKLNQTSKEPSVALFDILKLTDVINTSDDSDNEINYRRFTQIAERMFKKDLHDLKQRSEGNTRNVKKSTGFDGKKNARSSPDASGDLEWNADVESKSSVRIGTRATRHSNRENEETHSRVSQKEIGMESKIGQSTRSKTKSIADRKRSLMEEDAEQTILKKLKPDKIVEEHSISTRGRRNRTRIASDKQSSNTPEHSAKTNSRETSPVIESTRFSTNAKTAFKTTLEETQRTVHRSTHENVNSTRGKGAKRKSNVATMNETSDKSKLVPTTKVEKAEVNQEKILKVVFDPIRISESQEVEIIMASGMSKPQNDNLSVRKRSNVNILQRHTRSRKRLNTEAEENSVFTESNVSSIGDSDSAQSDNLASKPKRVRRAKKDSIFLSSEAKVPEKREVFKKPVLESSMRNSSSIGKNSQDSVRSSVSLNSRSSRSQTKKKEKLEAHQDTIEDSTSFRTSMENTSLLSTPSRTRRSTSVLITSTPIAAKHKILFTGITEDYSKTIKTLGGNKVEEPTKCTVLVTDKVRRTYKFLCALAKGVPIVSIDWLKDSAAAGQFLNWEGYLLKDPVAEAKFGFRLRKSLDKAKEKRLLDGYTVVLTSGVAPPPIDELKDMVTSCGGKTLLRPPNKWPERAVIVSREEDLTNARKFLAKAPKTVTVQSTEFILTGILRQETDFTKYKLI